MLTFAVSAAADGEATDLIVTPSVGEPRHYHIPGLGPDDYAAFHAALARDFGTRQPHDLIEQWQPAGPDPRWRPLLTDNVHPRILSGYGDPAVLRTDEGYVLIVTSNDAPDAFPILTSDDLEHWHPTGFAFPEG